MFACHPISTLFPYTTLFRSGCRAATLDGRHHLELAEAHMPGIGSAPASSVAMKDVSDLQPWAAHRDRKSTRLNSSHANISYAVFCLKKKKKTKRTTHIGKNY